jgi:hypothetical protein
MDHSTPSVALFRTVFQPLFALLKVTRTHVLQDVGGSKAFRRYAPQ